MAFEWTDVGKLIAPLAPTIGGLLGGLIPFPGGGLAGQALGNIIARQFGVEPTPDAVGNAVLSANNEVAIAKLRAATEEAKVQWPAIADMEKARLHYEEIALSQVNVTARAELLVESKFKTWWRPMNGWVLAGENASLGLMLLVGLVEAAMRSPQLLNTMQNSWPLIATVLGIPAAVVGVTVFSRTQEKVAAMTTGTPLATQKPPVKKVG